MSEMGGQKRSRAKRSAAGGVVYYNSATKERVPLLKVLTSDLMPIATITSA
jgi:hypothetical protein